MAHRSEARVAPPTGSYPTCDICGWHDRRLRLVGKAVTPEERLALHMWARHALPLPEHRLRNPEVKSEDEP